MNGNSKVKRIFYGDNEHQYGDLRIPQGNGPYPVVILTHGGFWRTSVGLDRMNKIGDYLLSQGFASWNIEYRRVGHEGGGWPGTLIDVAEAADYLNTLSETYPIDLNCVLTIGHSAGGQLAFWLAGRHRLSEENMLKSTENSIKIQGAVSLAGILDLALMQKVHSIRPDVVGNPVAEFLNGDPETVPERYAEACPSKLLPIGVKQLLVHGAVDIHVPIGISKTYQQAAMDAGEDIKMVEILRAEHTKVIDTNSETWLLMEPEIMSFLKSFS